MNSTTCNPSPLIDRGPVDSAGPAQHADADAPIINVNLLSPSSPSFDHGLPRDFMRAVCVDRVKGIWQFDLSRFQDWRDGESKKRVRRVSEDEAFIKARLLTKFGNLLISCNPTNYRIDLCLTPGV